MFNIIHEDANSLLTEEEGSYYRRVALSISANISPGSVEVSGDMHKLLPVFLTLLSENLN